MKDEALVNALKHDFRQANLSSADRTMLDYVDVLTSAPATVTKEMIDRLRDEGFGDKAILEINQISGFFAWCNRTIDGLGVELEEFWNDPNATNI